MPLFFAGFHILYITSTIFHYNWSISLKVIFLPLTCNGASSVSAPTDHYDGTGAIPRLVPRCANQRTTNAAQTDDEPPAAAKIRRTTTTVARLRGASNEECNFGLLALRQHRRSSTALYCSELGTADPDLAGPCPWGSPSTPPNCFLISDRPNAAKVKTARMILSSLQMIIRRIRPLANDHPKGPASCK